MCHYTQISAHLHRGETSVVQQKIPSRNSENLYRVPLQDFCTDYQPTTLLTISCPKYNFLVAASKCHLQYVQAQKAESIWRLCLLPGPRGFYYFQVQVSQFSSKSYLVTHTYVNLLLCVKHQKRCSQRQVSLNTISAYFVNKKYLFRLWKFIDVFILLYFLKILLLSFWQAQHSKRLY